MDKNRIGRILAKLELYWNRNPDLRLMQLLGNFFPGDGYYAEDMLIESVLDSCIKTRTIVPTEKGLKEIYEKFIGILNLPKGKKWRKNIKAKLKSK